jgi:pectate lyase
MTTFDDGLYQYGGVPVGGSIMGLIGDGKVFYVDPGNGATDNTGESPTNALKGLQAGIDKCVAGRGDVIVRLPGGEEVSETVAFNKSGITVVAATYGVNPYASGELFSTYAAATFTDGPAATITSRCTIIGLGFASRDTGATFYSGAAMLIGGDAGAGQFGAHIKNCRFPKWGLDNRIGLAVEGSSDVIIENCDFEGVGANFDSGIYVQGATANITIRYNHFRDCDTGIQFGAFTSGSPDCIIQGNVAVHGTLLETPGAAVGVVVDNYIPTLDVGNAYGSGVSLATLEGYGLWFANNHYSETP